MTDHPALAETHWRFIEAHFADPQRLRKGLAALDETARVALAAHVIVARNLVRNPRETPLADRDGTPLDPLDVEDLTDWIVGRGREAWSRLLGASDRVLLAERAVFLERSTPALLGEIYHAHAARSARDLNELVDRYLAAL